MNEGTVIKEVVIEAPAAKVWEAITNKVAMKQWYFDLAEFRPEVGFEFQFEGGDETRTFLHLCEITEVIPEEKLTHSWSYDGFPGKSFVTWELFDEGGATRVKLTHTGLETFPETNPSFAWKNFEAGWNDIVCTLLKNYVEKTLAEKQPQTA
ncbi:MAG TPA: SRPBCC domain-containing protein [Patescibacteria group bacterium]|nr:SRPBCC domain-containing protein [Patescibacteria group bacterium]